MSAVVWLLVVGVSLSQLSHSVALTPTKVEYERTFLRQEMLSRRNIAGHLRLVAGAVRLAFHDCVGGCDGCINLMNSENNGLGPTLNDLNGFYRNRNVAQLMSRADYWILASFAALDVALAEACPNNQPCNPAPLPLSFRYGRKDCSTSPSTGVMHTFPNAQAGTNATLAFFLQEFGLSDRQTVALLGAHTLGHATLRNSGFMGPWVKKENDLDNEFYRVLQNRNNDWRQIQLPSGNYQWNIRPAPPQIPPQLPPQLPDPSFMLNSDICLLKDITVDSSGSSGCPFSACLSSRTASVVNEYAQDNTRWLIDFSEAFMLMISKTSDTLWNPANGPAPSQAPTPPPPSTITTTSSSTPTANPSLDANTMEQERAFLRQEMLNRRNIAGHLRLVAGAVRLAFHDCVGGCDGCINLMNPENNGLAPTINDLNRFYRNRNVAQLMSRADYWVLAGYAALDVALAEACPNNEPCNPAPLPFSFQYGRLDCITSPSSEAQHTFPNAHAGMNETLAFFLQEFGLSDRQTVALLGAHTLGHATLRNSGFMGPWVKNENDLDNEFYRVLRNSNNDWRQIQLPSGNYQWNIRPGPPQFPPQLPDPSFMLNSDMCLLKDITADISGSSGCTFSACSSSRTASVVNEYAQDNGRWLRDFSEAFEIMVSKSVSSLQDVTGTTQVVNPRTTSVALRVTTDIWLLFTLFLFSGLEV